MAKTQRHKFRPLPPQRAFLKSTAIIRGYGGAVGGGKSRTGCEEIFRECLRNPGLIALVARDAHTSIIETTKKTMLNEVIPDNLIVHRKASGGEDYVELFNGSRIHFIGLDNPYKWYSSEVGYLFFDEAQELFDEDKVHRLMNRLRQRYPDGRSMPNRCIVTFNPGNPGHWLQNWFLIGATPTDFDVPGVRGARKNELKFSDEPDAESIGDVDFVSAKATDNPYLPEEYIKRLKAQPPHMRRRYFDGLWEYHDGSCFFDNDALSQYEKICVENPILLTGHLVGDIQEDIDIRLRRKSGPPENPIRVRPEKSGGSLVVWRKPIKEDPKTGLPHRYILTVDASSGKGEDFTGIQVLDVDEFEQAAEMQIKVPPEQSAEIAYKLGRIYNDALIVCEITGGWGFSVDQKLRRELRYKNPYTRQVLDRISKLFTDKAGFDTTKKTRPLILAALEEAVREKELGLYSLRALAEMAAFIIDDNGKAQARTGQHDDLVMSLALAVYVAQQQPKQLRRARQAQYTPQFPSTGY